MREYALSYVQVHVQTNLYKHSWSRWLLRLPSRRSSPPPLHIPARRRPYESNYLREFFKVMAEDNPTDSPKRKRGRPPKPESEKAAAKRKAADSGDDSAPKRGRGRPKGSKNKSKKGSPAKGTGKRGRPPKNAPKESASEESAEDAE
ncbi:high mobility group protein HMG-I/HMG-Y-like isoform X2 [Penaeus japonicus]|uniref:high mobility group protein HMG-I/HMG-Y-like isoform X2 n=1 Tax=Penaeus japonicus TaxID=27405 RepID=UPI001C70F077|nr:high mobility group protein HMG-I/HMG-Y-like isoform X2 [Penaeus japonicus]